MITNFEINTLYIKNENINSFASFSYFLINFMLRKLTTLYYAHIFRVNITPYLYVVPYDLNSRTSWKEALIISSLYWLLRRFLCRIYIRHQSKRAHRHVSQAHSHLPNLLKQRATLKATFLVFCGATIFCIIDWVVVVNISKPTMVRTLNPLQDLVEVESESLQKAPN